MVLFGASGDLTRRLLMPALYNLLCDGLLPPQLALVGIALDQLTTDSFRERLSHDIRTFNTRKELDPAAWDNLRSRLYYTPGNFGDEAAFVRLHELVTRLDAQYQARGNVLFYMATPPSVFGLISANLDRAGFSQRPGWKRIIVEKPFGTDLASAQELNRQILSHWQESQVYRVDHYLGKETVQNFLAFRFANEMFEPLWNKQHIDHIQLTVSEAVSVEGRGGYYDRSGVLRDMIQNHMFQMLAYICMEPPTSFEADDIRNEKAKVLRHPPLYPPGSAYQHRPGSIRPGPEGGWRSVPRLSPGIRRQSSVEYRDVRGAEAFHR
jgi:glucose-6-phosphate 1-dehydrogenase